MTDRFIPAIIGSLVGVIGVTLSTLSATPALIYLLIVFSFAAGVKFALWFLDR